MGDERVAEQALPVAYRFTSGPVDLRLDTVPVDFSTSSTSIHGTTPLSARLDYRVREHDVLRVYGQTASLPRTLSVEQTAAFGTVGTPTLDIESLSLGTQAIVGARITHEIPTDSMVMSVHGTVEVQPRPGDSESVYWQGTTLKGGASIEADAGDHRFNGRVELSKSLAGELDGRNLFPGGGTLSVSASGTGPLGTDGNMSWQLFGFYFRPIGAARPDQPNRLIPVGDFIGITSSLSVPAGLLLLWPSVDVMREASRAVSNSAGTRTEITGSSWTTNASTTLTIPVRSGIDFTPGAGYVFGSVGAKLSTTPVGAARATDMFTDRIRGWWVSSEVAIDF